MILLYFWAVNLNIQMILMRKESNINENSDFEDNDVSHDEEEEESTESSNESVAASSAFSQHPSPPSHTFRLISDAFSDRRPSELPHLEVDFSDVRPLAIDDNVLSLHYVR